MHPSITRGFAAILVVCPMPAAAQAAIEGVVAAPAAAAPAASAIVVPLAPPTGNAVLHTGTDVRFRLLQELTTEDKRLRVGDRFRLEVSEPVLVQGVTVVPVGTSAVGEITQVRNKGMWGKSGKFTARLLYLTANGRQIRLTGEFDDKGVAGGVGAVAVSALVFLPAGFFMTGTSARLPAGTVVGGLIDEDVPLVLPAQAALPPMVVEAVAPVPVGAAQTPTLGTGEGLQPGVEASVVTVSETK
jgi:hypothetical protein